MAMAKFIKLNPQEETKLTRIKHYKQIFDQNTLIELIKKYDEKLLFKLAIVDPEINKICKSTELIFYWEDIWRGSGINPRERAKINHEPIHEYQPMSTIPSCFDLLKGHYLYEVYRQTFKEAEHTSQFYEDAEKYLAASAQFGCFFALNALCKGGLVLLKNKFDDDIAGKVIFYAETAATSYLSPGYLLLANVYHELSQYQQQPFFLGKNLQIGALQAIEVAKKLEPHSGPMLNNAYQGKSLFEASNGKITTFFQAQLRLQQHLNVSPKDLDIAMNNAKTIVKKIQNELEQHQTELNLAIDSHNEVEVLPAAEDGSSMLIW